MDRRNKLYQLLEKCSYRPITYWPVFAYLFGGINAAIFLQQICFWSDKGWSKDGVIYKTIKEMEEETLLTEGMQSRAKEKLVKLGVLDTCLKKVKGAPTLHYRVNWGILIKMVLDFHKIQESSISDKTNRESTAFPSSEGNATLSEGEPVLKIRKKGHVNYKSDSIQDLIEIFSRQFTKEFGVPYITEAMDRKRIRQVLVMDFTHDDIADLFDWWFRLVLPDKRIAHIKNALSNSSLNEYRIENYQRFMKRQLPTAKTTDIGKHEVTSKIWHTPGIQQY